MIKWIILIIFAVIVFKCGIGKGLLHLLKVAIYPGIFALIGCFTLSVLTGSGALAVIGAVVGAIIGFVVAARTNKV